MASAWTYDEQTLEDACDMHLPEGYINFEQFEKEIQAAQNNNYTRHRADEEVDLRHDPIARIQLGAMVKAVADSNRIPMGKLPTAGQLLSDHTADQEHEITQMLRNAGLPAERPDYKVSSKTARKGIYTGNEPLPVTGLKNVYVDDSFFAMDTSTTKVIAVIDDKSGKTITEPNLVAMNGSSRKIILSRLNGSEQSTVKSDNSIIASEASPVEKVSRTRYITPKEVYMRKKMAKK